MRARTGHRGRVPGFSLVELVVVVVILGIVGAIAVPRLSRGAAAARQSRLLDDTRTLQSAVERYKAEHAGRSPARDKTGAIDLSGANFAKRLLLRTTVEGQLNPAGLYGPYLREFPAHAVTKLQTLRVNGADPGAGTHGWHFGTGTGLIIPDDAERSILDVLGGDSPIVDVLTR